MHESAIEPEELATAKDSIARSLPGQFETTPESASSIGQLYVHRLPLSYYHDLPEQIQKVSAAEVQRVAQKYLKPEEMVIVAVGDRNKIESELEKLNLGPVEIRDSSGNPAE
jgi:zinc protease